MIIRKPYAFLIKHFRKIHIVLLILTCYLYYKNLQLTSFINEFMNYGTYNAATESISNYISIFTYTATLAIVLGTLMLIVLLRHKEKPWKLYLLPVIEYLTLYAIYASTKLFFNTYDGQLHSVTIRAIRDLLLITSLVQYPIFILYIGRIVGVDLKKFNFTTDKEYLELSSEDKEELEININFDKYSVKRGINKLKRNSGYIYQEHKLFINTLVILFVAFSLYYSYTYIFVTNKVYKETQSFDANGYTITINKSYYTDKDFKGDIISKKSAFVILNLTIKNNKQTRSIDLNKFHIVNGIADYTTTEKVFQNEFQDFGKTYAKKELKPNESFNLIMVYNVDQKYSPKKFVLYYQEYLGQKPHLRKIKLKLNDVSKINKNEIIKLDEELKFTLKEQEEKLTLDSYSFVTETDYTYKNCSDVNCELNTGKIIANPTTKILKITFASSNFEGKDMIDFSSQYGKIIYINNKGKAKIIDIESYVDKTYYGKYLYLKVPEEIETANSIELKYIIRNQEYTYKLK